MSMLLPTNNYYFNSIRTHLSRKRENAPSTSESDDQDTIDLDDDLQLRPTSSHENHDVVFTPQSWQKSVPPSTAPTSIKFTPPQSSSSTNGCRESRKRASGKLGVISFRCPRDLSRLRYPDGTSCLIRRGVFKGLVDRRPALCPYTNSESLSSCTFRNCCCMRASLVPSPLHHSIVAEDFAPHNEDETDLYDEYPSFGEKIRQISWSKLKTLIDSVDGKDDWVTIENLISNPSTRPSGGRSLHHPRLRKSFHGNLKRFVGHRVAVDMKTEIIVRPLSRPAQDIVDGVSEPTRSLLSPGRSRSVSV